MASGPPLRRFEVLLNTRWQRDMTSKGEVWPELKR